MAKVAMHMIGNSTQRTFSQRDSLKLATSCSNSKVRYSAP